MGITDYVVLNSKVTCPHHQVVYHHVHSQRATMPPLGQGHLV